jgi:hypothetical protein
MVGCSGRIGSCGWSRDADYCLRVRLWSSLLEDTEEFALAGRASRWREDCRDCSAPHHFRNPCLYSFVQPGTFLRGAGRREPSVGNGPFGGRLISVRRSVRALKREQRERDEGVVLCGLGRAKGRQKAPDGYRNLTTWWSTRGGARYHH